MGDFEQVYRTYFRDVYQYIRGLSGDAQLAEEITGEAFFKALQAYDRFRGDCDIRVWLCQIAKNCYFSHSKRSKRAQPLETDVPAETPHPETRLLQKERAEAVRRILHSLPEPYREVFLWRVYGELSFREIGKLFEKTENWACVTYHRARGKILDRLEESEDGENL